MLSKAALWDEGHWKSDLESFVSKFLKGSDMVDRFGMKGAMYRVWKGFRVIRELTGIKSVNRESK